MILFKESADLSNWITTRQNSGKTIGFVPTMGALHEGHIHLIRSAQTVADISVCSIFVNPSQFNDPADFKKYPVSLEKDIQMLVNAGTDLLFLPDVNQMYPQGIHHLESYSLGELEVLLEGRYRPGHFQGVCQVMNRLLTMVHPDDLIMGQKDFQQCLIVKRLLNIMQSTVRFHQIPTIRESDGLAQSSRNRRLSPEQRENAVAIAQALALIRDNLPGQEFEQVIGQARQKLESAHFKTDYIAIARADNLQPIHRWNPKDKSVALIAAFQGEVRLIDNMLLN